MTRPETVVEAKHCYRCHQQPMMEHIGWWVVRCCDKTVEGHGNTRDEAVTDWNEKNEAKHGN